VTETRGQDESTASAAGAAPGEPAHGGAAAPEAAPEPTGKQPSAPDIRHVVTLLTIPPVVMLGTLLFVLFRHEIALDPLAVGLIAGAFVSLAVLVIVRFVIPRS
jgi:hypothetical protein